MIYSFTHPLKIVSDGGIVEIKELDIDLNSLTLSDQCEIEKEYYKYLEESKANIPPLTRKISFKWISLQIYALLIKQYPRVNISRSDILKMSWEDSTKLSILFETGYLTTLADIETEMALNSVDFAERLTKDDK